jgi:probable rRNA maturation factor
MVDYAIEVDFEVPLLADPPAERLQSWAATALAMGGTPIGAELTIVITDDAHIQALNRQYLATDAPTDVLSFPAADAEGEFITPEELSPYLGDIVISLPAAQRQSRALNRSLADELALLVVHGCLHLLGHDHADNAERDRMWSLQEETLRRLGIAPEGLISDDPESDDTT